MSDRDDATRALAEVVLIDRSAQQDELAAAVARHISNRPARDRKPPDPAVLEQLRKEKP